MTAGARLLGVGLAVALGCWACAGSPTPPPAGAAETFPPDLPTVAPATFDADEPDPLEPSPTPPQSASLACVASPPVVAPGQPFQIQLTELGSWYGTHRWYEITGLEQGFQQFDLDDGRAGPRVVYAGTAPTGGNWTFAVYMWDWDRNGTHPGLPGAQQTIRPDGTQHEGSCGGSLEVVLTP